MGSRTIRRGLDAVKTLAWAKQDNRAFEDAHNLIVEYTTTTGVIGVLLLAVWIVLAVRGARGPWLLAAGVGGAGMLIQPQSVITTPLVLLALALARDPVAVRVSRRVAVLASALFAVAAGALLVGDARLLKIRTDFDLAAYDSADALLPPWSEAPTLASRIALVSGDDPSRTRRAIGFASEAVRRDRSNVPAWARLANLQAIDGDLASGLENFEEALRRDPWSEPALRGRAEVAVTLGDDATASAMCRRLPHGDDKGAEVRR